MKIAFNTWVYSSFPVWVPSYPLTDTIERIAAIGLVGCACIFAAMLAVELVPMLGRRRQASA